MSEVFIIGAGASVPYGFPSGVKLFESIRDYYYKLVVRSNSKNADLSNNHEKILKVMYNDIPFGKGADYEMNGVDIFTSREMKKLLETHVEPFFSSIRKSVMVSIDEFLKNRIAKDYGHVADFGKRLIAFEILRYERITMSERTEKKITNVFSPYGALYEIDWLQHLLSKIDQLYPHDRKDDKITHLKNITFFTFNYDRLLEKMIHNYLIADLQFSEDEADNIVDEMSKTNIIHVNGCIGTLREVPFGGSDTGMDYSKIANNMKLVWDMKIETSSDADNRKKEYLNTIKKAKMVYSLGFSYIYGNLESLGIDADAKPFGGSRKKFIGTGKDMADQNISRVLNYLGLPNFDSKKEAWMIKNTTALDLITSHYHPNTYGWSQAEQT